MKVTSQSPWVKRLQSSTFVVLLCTVIAVLAWLGTRYSHEVDWTASQRNTLSTFSQAVLGELHGALTITAVIGHDVILRKRITALVERYQRYKPDILLHFVDADDQPQLLRRMGGTANGSLLLEYQGRSEMLGDITEQALTNALQRLLRRAERWLVFLAGHGERKPHGTANHDLANWVRELEASGFHVVTANLAEHGQLPGNTAVLVIAGPQVDLLAGEVALIKDYVAGGGNLLWLTDPGNHHGLERLAEDLGIHFPDGVVVDATTRLFGIASPTVAIVAGYDGKVPLVHDFDKLTLFPRAAAIDLLAADNTWQAGTVLRTTQKSWLETGELQGTLTFDSTQDRPGPVTIGVVLMRNPGVSGGQPDSSSGQRAIGGQAAVFPGPASAGQRIVVVGDGDFLSNAYLGNGGNLELGMKLANWLAGDDELVAIPVHVASDRTLNLSPVTMMIIASGLLFVVPLALGGSGALIWWRRRRR